MQSRTQSCDADREGIVKKMGNEDLKTEKGGANKKTDTKP